jgi:hypothetical protein
MAILNHSKKRKKEFIYVCSVCGIRHSFSHRLEKQDSKICVNIDCRGDLELSEVYEETKPEKEVIVK